MKRILMLVFAFVSLATCAVGQETRATLTGRITDPTGASVPNVQVVVTNMDTGAATTVQSTRAGDYTAPYLLPGTYKVSAQVAGFKDYVHMGLVIETEQTVTENIALQIGNVSESVTVTSGTPLVDTANADLGQSLTSEAVMDLPNQGRAPLGYAHFEYGAVAKGKHAQQANTPYGQAAAQDFSLGGGASSSNELLLNGVPNMEDSARAAGFSPQLDAVDAVHVDEFAANAALGDTNGGVVNITTKGGTNQIHGSASEYYNGSRPFEGLPYQFAVPTTSAPITSTHYNQFGGTIGGPIVIPHVINGHNKLFFFYAFEGYIGNSPSTVPTSVPTAAERQGDFSALLAYNAADQLYNPYQGGNQAIDKGNYWIRPAIPNNCLTNQSTYCAGVANAGLTLNPVYVAYLNKIPLPNVSNAPADGEDNYYAYDPTTNNYKSHQGRFDYNISDSDKLYVEGHRSQYNSTANDYFHTALTGTNTLTVLWGGQVDNVKAFTPSTSLETRLGFSRYETNSEPASLGLSPTNYGFNGALAQNSTAVALPALSFTDSVGVANLSADPGSPEYFDDIQFFTSFNKTWGAHSFKIGADIRSNKKSALSAKGANGDFTFKASNGDFITQSPNDAAKNTNQAFGGALALFALGLPSSGSYAINPRYQFDNWYSGFFAQDDWKAMHNLTVSMGVRIEHETPLVESNNKMGQNWNPLLTNAVTSGSESTYSSQLAADSKTVVGTTCNGAPCTNYLPSGINTSGGFVYATDGNRSPYYPANVYLSPRLGFSYAPDFFHGTLAIRGGVALYVNPFSDVNAGQNYGFTQTTTYSASNTSCNTGYTPIQTFDNPFPTTEATLPVTADNCPQSVNPIQPPVGALQGINVNLGQGMSWYAPVKVPYNEKFTLDVQKQFAKNWMVEIGGFHVLGIHSSYTDSGLSSAPLLQYYDSTQNKSTTNALNVSDAMAVPVTNPFLGTMPGYTNPATGTPFANTTGLNTGKTVTQSQLLQSYPEYSSVGEALVPSEKMYFNALLFQVNKRMSNGLEFVFNYQWSRQTGTAAGIQLNSGGPLWHGETTSDFPQHMSVTAQYQLPFGRGRMLFSNDNRWIDEGIGGWEVTGIYQYLSGTPLTWSTKVNYSGNYHDFNNSPHRPEAAGPSFNITNFDNYSNDPKGTNQPGSWNPEIFPEYALRGDPNNNFDFSILKDFTVWERVVVQPRVDAFNALNHPQFTQSGNTNPTATSFGLVNAQLNSARNLDGGIHIIF
ncbi:MAG: carboxypeptidase regulatory-like domain-containing protein [Terracidiphilus sp.]|jgi:hypothetical protein